MKLSFGIDLKCDKCGRIFETERGKNIHRASHKQKTYQTASSLVIHGLGKGKMIGKFRKVVQKYSHNPLEGQDIELFLRGNKKV